jgi:hypothetical protein
MVRLWKYVKTLSKMSGITPDSENETIEQYIKKAGNYLLKNNTTVTLDWVFEESKYYIDAK